MPTRNVNLTSQLDQFVERAVASGKYGNASEVVRDGLRALQRDAAEDKARLQWLKGAVSAGIASLEAGEGRGLKSRSDLRGHIDNLVATASANRTRRRKRA